MNETMVCLDAINYACITELGKLRKQTDHNFLHTSDSDYLD